jgi:hypothetical protein
MNARTAAAAVAKRLLPVIFLHWSFKRALNSTYDWASTAAGRSMGEETLILLLANNGARRGTPTAGLG